MKSLKDVEGASIGVHDTVMVRGIVNARAVNSINLVNGTLEIVSADGHVMNVSPDHCLIIKKAYGDLAVPPTMPAPTMPAPTMPAPTPAPTMPAPTPEPKSRLNVLVHLKATLPSWPTNIREDKSLDGCGGWLWTMINGLPTAYCPSKEWHIHRDEWSVGRVAPAMPTTALQPCERVEALDGEGVYEECITVGPHPHGTGEFIFITEVGMTFVSRTFRPVKTECEKVVAATLEHLGYDAGQFEIDGSGDDPDICEDLIKLFKAGYLIAPK